MFQPPATVATRDDAGLLPVGTFILWIACLAIGLLGLGFSYAHTRPKPAAPEATRAELITVELTGEPLPEPDSPPPPFDPLQPPPLAPAVLPPPAAPPLLRLAQPSPAVAFALPVPVPAKIVEAKEASYARAPETATPPAPVHPPVQPLTFGQGEGKQPLPTYPRQALKLGQEGIVMIRLSVGESGRVLSAEASRPSPWPLLNNEAVRVVRERWRFRPGPARLYEVEIRFELNK